MRRRHGRNGASRGTEAARSMPSRRPLYTSSASPAWRRTSHASGTRWPIPRHHSSYAGTSRPARRTSCASSSGRHSTGTPSIHLVTRTPRPARGSGDVLRGGRTPGQPSAGAVSRLAGLLRVATTPGGEAAAPSGDDRRRRRDRSAQRIQVLQLSCSSPDVGDRVDIVEREREALGARIEPTIALGVRIAACLVPRGQNGGGLLHYATGRRLLGALGLGESTSGARPTSAG